MLRKTLNRCRILLVQSDALIALKLAEAFAEVDAEVVTTFGLPESFHAIGKYRLDGAVVHLDLDGVSALPAAVLLHEMKIPLAVVSQNHMSAFLARHLPGAVALEPGFSPKLAVGAIMRAVGRQPPAHLPLHLVAQAPQRQN